MPKHFCLVIIDIITDKIKTEINTTQTSFYNHVPKVSVGIMTSNFTYHVLIGIKTTDLTL